MPEKALEMKLKLDANGNVVTKDVNGVKMPVYVHDDGKEIEFDAAATVASIARLNSEAKGHRERAEAVAKELKAFEGIKDPTAALAALQMVTDLGHKKLVDAGKLDEVRGEVEKVYKGQLAERDTAIAGLNDKLFTLHVTGAFASSKVIKEKLNIPPDMVQARFGQHFGISETGELYATDKNGNKLYSPRNPGQTASFDEAVEILIDSYPYKDSILKGTGASGSGSSGTSGANGKRTFTRQQFEQMPDAERAGMSSALRKGEVVLTD